MDRIRRSFRESFRRRSSRDHNNLRNSQSPGAQPSSATNNASSQPGASSSNNASSNSRPQTGAISSTSSGKADLWQPDETAVREGTCSFNVKYLGGVEVFESRGMQVCEGALKLLRVFNFKFNSIFDFFSLFIQ
ncbi:unnamed protein product [Anisakis simplex]|uniref:Numb-related protein 1 (inferred by orthology to a C. elegans protein) n=1 Tax=Anisakis simplex TaxID=6269 RepID=A0A0M3KBJ6_ANISI|nr:unnamed protein product [Anisakis simplex]